MVQEGIIVAYVDATNYGLGGNERISQNMGAIEEKDAVGNQEGLFYLRSLGIWRRIVKLTWKKEIMQDKSKGKNLWLRTLQKD
jgi:hypothetical protein